MLSQHSLINDDSNKIFLQSQSVKNLHKDGKIPKIVSNEILNKHNGSGILLKNDFSKLFNSA